MLWLCFNTAGSGSSRNPKYITEQKKKHKRINIMIKFDLKSKNTFNTTYTSDEVYEFIQLI